MILRREREPSFVLCTVYLGIARSLNEMNLKRKTPQIDLTRWEVVGKTVHVYKYLFRLNI